MVDFYEQKPIFLLLLANFQKQLEIFKILFCVVKNHPMDELNICFF